MNVEKVIAIGCDHAGYDYKELIRQSLEEKGYAVLDMGTHSDDSVDYPDFIHPVAQHVQEERAKYGIVICGSGNGVAMTANKHQGIRAALCWREDITELARQHNNANVLALPSRFISEEEALRFVDVFINTEFEGGRHKRRVDKIACANSVNS